MSLRSEPSFPQSLKSVFASSIIRVGVVLIPGACAICFIVFHRLSCSRDTRRFPQDGMIAPWIGNCYFVNECTRHELKILIDLRLCEQINRNQRQQKVRNKDRCSSIILSHSLPKEERSDRSRGNDRAVKRNG